MWNVSFDKIVGERIACRTSGDNSVAYRKEYTKGNKEFYTEKKQIQQRIYRVDKGPWTHHQMPWCTPNYSKDNGTSCRTTHSKEWKNLSLLASNSSNGRGPCHSLSPYIRCYNWKAVHEWFHEPTHSLYKSRKEHPAHTPKYELNSPPLPVEQLSSQRENVQNNGTWGESECDSSP